MSKVYVKLLSYFVISLILILILSSKIIPAQFYDQQQSLAYATPNLGNSISIQVPAITQPSDILEGGQSYLLNGLTNTGYWYQWGVGEDDYPNLPTGEFYMVYEVFNPNSTLQSPSSYVEFSGGSVNEGDEILLTMQIESGQVVMTATDEDTGATAHYSYNTEGATQFIGTPNGPANNKGFFTGLMSEQYFTKPTWYRLGTQIVTYTPTTQSQTAPPAWMVSTETECVGYGIYCGGPPVYDVVISARSPPQPVLTLFVENESEAGTTALESAYLSDGSYQTGLYSVLSSTAQSYTLQNQPDQINSFLVTEYPLNMEILLVKGALHQALIINGPVSRINYTLCDGSSSVCPTTPGQYQVITHAFPTSNESDLGTVLSTGFNITVEPQGVSEAICPNNDQNNGGPINTFNGTAPTTGTMPPQCGVQCPNNAFNPLPEGFAGVGTQYCNIFCPNGQDNYAGGPGNDAPCTQCPNGVITTGQCSQYCFNGWGLIISPDSACAGFGTPLNYTYIGNCGLVIPSNPNAYNNNGIHHDLAGSNLGSGSGGINTGFGDVPFGGSSGIGQLCYNLLINNTNSSILIGKNTISNNTTQSSGPFGGFLNHLLGTASATTTIETKKS
jgi:hypothetical protein